MYYESTRGGLSSIRSSEAIVRGIAPDGGLFVPSEIVEISLDNIAALSEMSYQERAVFILRYFLTDFTENEIEVCVNNAYTDEKYTSKDIVPLKKLTDNMYIMELWHGPTCAFKDMALQILPHFLVKAAKKVQETCEIVILVATSGDTGKAALEGFADVEGTRIIVFYPKDGVSEVQKMQMITQKGGNVKVIGVCGNFDDTQTGVKQIFTDDEVITKMKKNGYKFSSANSINWGRLVPQIVYYFSAYADMLKRGSIKLGDKINFVVPTGNFGDILAGWYASKMGLPVNRLLCASNDNNVLTDFLNTGVYDRRRDFIRTVSPSMDILISSNLERLLYEITGKNKSKINSWMDDLASKGVYDVGSYLRDILQRDFWAGFSTQKETLNTIKNVYKEYNYLIDTHTAVAVDVYDKYVISTGDLTPSVIASTASPFKFNKSVAGAVLDSKLIEGRTEFELLKILSENTGWDIPEGLKDLDKLEVRHKETCFKKEMKSRVLSSLGI